MRFRQFIEAGTAAPIKSPYTGKPHTAGPLNLPDLRQLQEPDESPHGGWQSFTQMTQQKMRQDRQQYYVLNTLELIGSLATNIYQAWQMRMQGQQVSIYQQAYYDQNSDLLGGIGRNEIEGAGGYKRLDPQQMATAQKMGVIQLDPQNQQNLAINVAALKQQMNAVKQRLEQYKQMMHRAGQADTGLQHLKGVAGQALNAMTGPGKVQLSKSANPWN